MAFKPNQMTLLMTTIEEMRNERIEFETSPLTLDDVMTMFIRKEDHSIMQRAADLMQIKYYDRVITTNLPTKKYSDVYTNIRLNGTKHDGSPMFLVPKYACDVAPLLSQVSEALDAHLTSLIDLRIDFEYVKRALSQLNDLCPAPAHVAFFWPSIRIIAERAAKLQEDIGGKIIDSINAPTKKGMPALDPNLRLACKETAEIITAAHILGKSPNVADLRYSVTLYHGKYHWRNTPIGQIYAQ